ncbi:hypothetical protein JCM10908_002688 [Rhodotorula pacifica]|uniref:uncharacterized protein n=1 Tax=Rhodotorula pacifica TaxID=1495444 RepID=UPI00317DCDA1
MLPWNPPSAFSLAGNNNNSTSSNNGGGGGGYSPYADSQMSQQQHQQHQQQLQHQQQQLQQGQGQQSGQGQGQQNGGGPPSQQQQQQQQNLNQPPQSSQQQQPQAGGAYPPMTLASTLHFLQSEHRRYARDRNEWEIERAEMRARIALLEGEKRGNEGALKSLARRCKMLEMALRGERSKFLTSSTGGGLNPAAVSSAALSAAGGGGASPALMSGTASPIPGALASTAAAAIPNKAFAALQAGLSPASTPGDAPKSIPMTTSTSSPGQAAGMLPHSAAAAHARSDSVSSGAGAAPNAPSTTNGYQSGTWATTASASASAPRDPRGKARSREYLKQCLQEITYLTSSATLNPLAAHSYAAPGVNRPRKVLPEQVPPPPPAAAGAGSQQPGVINLAAVSAATAATTATLQLAPVSASAPSLTATTTPSPSPGPEFEPVAASSTSSAAAAPTPTPASASAQSSSSLTAATPVAFPSIGAGSASETTGGVEEKQSKEKEEKEEDVFASTPVPTSNGVATSSSSTSSSTADEDLDEEEDEEEKEEREGSDLPSAFVPLKRQPTSTGSVRGSRGGGGAGGTKGRDAIKLGGAAGLEKGQGKEDEALPESETLVTSATTSGEKEGEKKEETPTEATSAVAEEEKEKASPGPASSSSSAGESKESTPKSDQPTPDVETLSPPSSTTTEAPATSGQQEEEPEEEVEAVGSAAGRGDGEAQGKSDKEEQKEVAEPATEEADKESISSRQRVAAAATATTVVEEEEQEAAAAAGVLTISKGRNDRRGGGGGLGDLFSQGGGARAGSGLDGEGSVLPSERGNGEINNGTGQNGRGDDESQQHAQQDEEEEVPTALYRPEEDWKEKLARAGKKAYPPVRAPGGGGGGDAQLERLQWDLDELPSDEDRDVEGGEAVGGRGRLKPKAAANRSSSQEKSEEQRRFKSERVLRSHLDAVRVVEIVEMDDGAAVEVVSGSDDCTVKVWRGVTAPSGPRSELEPVATYRGHAAPVTALAIATTSPSVVTPANPDTERVVLSGSLDSTICVWRYATSSASTYDPVDNASLLGTIETKSDAVWGIVPLQGDRLACITAEGAVQVWSWETGELERSWTGRREGTSKASVNVPTAMCLYRPDSASAEEALLVAFANGEVQTFDPNTGAEQRTLTATDLRDADKENSQINALATNGRWLLVGYEDRSVTIFDLEKGQRLCNYIAHLDGITSLAFLPLPASDAPPPPDPTLSAAQPSMRFVSASHDTSIRIWCWSTINSAQPVCVQDLQAHRVKGADGVLDLGVGVVRAHEQGNGYETEREEEEEKVVLVSAGADGTLRVYSASSSSSLTLAAAGRGESV